MSSSSFYATEVAFNNTGKSGAKTKSNTGDDEKDGYLTYASQTVGDRKDGYLNPLPEINDGYTAINDKVLQRKRPLPMPPAFNPPQKNSACWQTCKELCSYCVGSRLILSLPLLVLAVTSLSVLIYLLVTNIPTEPKTPTTLIPTMGPPDYGVPTGSNGSLKFIMSNVQSPETLNLLQESMGQNVTILQNVKLNFTNKTWSFDGFNIWIAKLIVDDLYSQIVLNMEISNTQCRHSGNYTVLISGSNSKDEQRLTYKVKAPCPCESEYQVNSAKVLTCKLKVVGSTALHLDKASGEDIKPILNQTGIRIPDNVPERGRFSAEWNHNGMLTARIKFSPVRCHDEGNYSMTVTSRGGTQLHYMYIKVIDRPTEPTIRTRRGLIQGKENELQCQASTFCTNASLIVESTLEKGSGYVPWPDNLTTTHYQENYIWKANTSLILTGHTVDNQQNKCFRCTYSIENKTYYSHPLCIKLIPANFCGNRDSKCQYPHPYDCNKYITCNVDPVESTCPAGLHYLWKNCTGECVYPSQANCNKGLLNGCHCEVI